MKLTSKILLYPTPPGATSAYEYRYYGKPAGVDMVRLRYLDVADDIFDGGELSFSGDNGQTWSAPRPHGAARKTERGTLRTFDGLGFIDPVKGLLVNLCLEGLFTGMHALEGMSQYYLRYRVSKDGGRTSLVDERVIQRDPTEGPGTNIPKGPGQHEARAGQAPRLTGTPGTPGTYTPDHPCQHVWIGKNCITMPANQSMVRTQAGHLCVCVSISVPDKDGKPANPGGGYTWLEELILLGHWRVDGSGHIDWECGPRLSLPPEKSTRGLDESAMSIMPDGRLLLVMRASNGGTKDPDCKIPGHKWFVISSNHGRSWTEPAPWTYHEGGAFFSPGSMCTITRHSNGEYYWVGNIVPSNPRGNHLRFPLVIGRIDPRTCLLRRDSLFVVETRQPGEPELIQFSNFSTREDRASGELVIDVPRFVPVGESWTGDTYEYRVEV